MAIVKLDAKHINIGLPISFTIATYLLLDHLNVSQFVWGIYAVFIILYWILSILMFFQSVFKAKRAEILKDGSIKITDEIWK